VTRAPSGSSGNALAGKRIGLLTASASRLGGGVFEAVVAHADLIRRLGATPVIFALHDRHSDEDRGRFGDAQVFTAPIKGPAQVGYSPELDAALQSQGLDALHLHGIWMYPSRAGANWALATHRPYFISPHGMLDPWITARGRWKKALARLGYERRSWAAAHALHALTPQEAKDIAREAQRSDSLVIPNMGPAAKPSVAARDPLCVYIGRIHSKKNLLALVAAWKAAQLPDAARLVIAGWGDEGDVDALTAAIGDDAQGISFIGPIFGDAKDALLASARFVVLPSLSEGLPMAMLEAWAYGTPTIMTAQCNLPEGFAGGAALECGYDAPAIAPVIERGMAMDDGEWDVMSAASLALAEGQFSAGSVVAQWGEAYAAALSQAGR
jgi:glycosyltransferase involved in cell wall biosynthesis